MLFNIFSRRHIEIFYHFLQKETICIKCRILFSRNSKKYFITLLSADFAKRVVNVNTVQRIVVVRANTFCLSRCFNSMTAHVLYETVNILRWTGSFASGQYYHMSMHCYCQWDMAVPLGAYSHEMLIPISGGNKKAKLPVISRLSFIFSTSDRRVLRFLLFLCYVKLIKE